MLPNSGARCAEPNAGGAQSILGFGSNGSKCGAPIRRTQVALAKQRNSNFWQSSDIKIASSKYVLRKRPITHHAQAAFPP